jgi:hypothetical protein
MDITRVSETYSNLGRIGGGRPNLPEPQGEFPQGLVDGHSDEKEQTNLLDRLIKTKPKTEEKSLLNTNQAFAVSTALVEAIRDGSNSPMSLGSHDVTQLRLIPSRYV